MTRMRSCLLILIMSASFTMTLSGLARAEHCEKWVAKAVSVQGTVEARRAGDTQWLPVRSNDTYCTGDVIRVQKRSRADIELVNKPVLHLDQNTVITLGGLRDGQTSLIELIKGAAHFLSRVALGLEVQTAFVNAGVEGTEFYIRVADDRAELSIFEGKVLASNKEGTLAITGGQSAIAEAGKAPAARVVMRPRDAVQWALYYPPVVSYRSDEFQDQDWQGMVKRSLESYEKGDLSGAFAAIEGAPTDVSDPRLSLYRASLLLSVGRVDEAGADIDRALGIAPRDSNAFALQSIIALTRNEKETAITLAQKAVETGPQSATARVALSYAQQAGFNLKGALASLNDAVKLDPQNALAWARLAELQMSLGEYDKALKAARKATALNPDLSRTQTVLGFAYLIQARLRESQDAFTKAIALDAADPLPRLGLGLAKIRRGNLNEGGREIELAASLDPGNALVRSYLGKAFFEEKRDKYAADELDMARQLDPSDPTPYFYEAILKQMTNQPAEALHDLQQAIALNDNRAVYRSRLLLDADLAARSASLARIYGDLGFQQRALVEGWNSLNADPADFSGHRFLADTYAALPRHEIARVSDLLQSQLLQPLNITPIQPHLAESNQFIISGAGPSDLSFNEFNPLFNRNRIGVQASGIAGSNNTRGGEMAASGVYNNVSVSGGWFYNETDGFRQNADLKDDIANLFVQSSFSPATSVQAEYRYRKTDRGDLTQRFLPEDFYPSQRAKQETSSVRLGFHHAFLPGSDLIGSAMYQNLDAGYHDSPDPVFFPSLDIKTDEHAKSGELQHLFSSKYIKTVIGAGYFSIHKNEAETDVFPDPFDPDPFNPTLPPMVITLPSTKKNIRHANYYLYTYIAVPKNVTFTVGGSADSLSGGLEDKDQFNPKFGVTWKPVPDTTIRAAYFRTLKRTLITNQTIEPTQVAGFNQFFDDADSTESWRRGVAIDQKFSANIFGGVEYSRRDLTVPIEYTDDSLVTEVRHSDWDEKTGRAYLYWTPDNWVSLSAEYQCEQFERGTEFSGSTGSERVKDVKTQRVPLGVNLYLPAGLSAMVKATYYDQKGEFQPQGAAGFDPLTGSPVFVSGQDNFWLFDAAISYRLPRRYGMITIGAKNLFDKSFQYADMDPVSPAIQPNRFLYARATVAF